MSTDGRSRRPLGTATRRLPAVLSGVGGFALGYAAFVALYAPQIHREFVDGGVLSMAREAGVSPPAGWQLAGLFYVVVHGASFEVHTADGGYATAVVPTLFEPLGVAPPVVPWLIAPLSLLVAGAVAASLSSPRGGTEAAGIGATVAVGYLAAVLVGVVAFSWSGTVPATGRTLVVEADLLSTVAFAGVLYPLVFGSVGGFLAHVAFGPDDPRPGVLVRPAPTGGMSEPEPQSDELPRTEAEWREVLTDEEYRILREKGTEPKFTGDLIDVDEAGTFRCAGCSQALFTSEQKYGSGHGWPSFYDVASEDSIETEVDTSHGMRRIEVLCSRCGGHLGHVFDDGPDPTGKRYCINSAALEFDPEE